MSQIFLTITLQLSSVIPVPNLIIIGAKARNNKVTIGEGALCPEAEGLIKPMPSRVKTDFRGIF